MSRCVQRTKIGGRLAVPLPTACQSCKQREVPWFSDIESRPDATNFGHFGVRPDYFELAKIDLPDASAHLIELIHREAAILEQK
jgi:hypothetical protein